MSEAGPSIRIDKWLWFARMAKTRSLAARLCEGGRVEIAGASIVKPHHPVRVGDSVCVMQGRARRGLVVRELGARRGPAEEARRLYDEPLPPVPVVSNAPPWTPLLDEESWPDRRGP